MPALHVYVRLVLRPDFLDLCNPPELAFGWWTVDGFTLSVQGFPGLLSG